METKKSALSHSAIKEIAKKAQRYLQEVDGETFADLYELADTYTSEIKHITKDAEPFDSCATVYRLKDRGFISELSAEKLGLIRLYKWNAVEVCDTVYFYNTATNDDKSRAEKADALSALNSIILN